MVTHARRWTARRARPRTWPEGSPAAPGAAPRREPWLGASERAGGRAGEEGEGVFVAAVKMEACIDLNLIDRSQFQFALRRHSA